MAVKITTSQSNVLGGTYGAVLPAASSPTSGTPLYASYTPTVSSPSRTAWEPTTGSAGANVNIGPVPAPSVPTPAITGANTVNTNKEQYFNGSVVGTVGSLTGGPSGGYGGVTNEGVIVGNPDVEKMPTIAEPSSYAANIDPPIVNSTPTLDVEALSQSGENFNTGVRGIIENIIVPMKVSPQTTGNSGLSTGSTGQSGTVESNQEENNVLSYEDYIQQMKEGYQTQLDAQKAEAARVKERAMINAESAYAQNKATYGANAEIMAQMGLNGGGYSDYLNAQAYAQKRSDVQAANANEIAQNAAAESTYQQYIAQLNQSLAEKALYDQRLKDEREYNEKMLNEQREYETAQEEKKKRENLYASLWEGVQDPNSGYTAQSIEELANEYQLTDEQRESLKNILSATQAKTQEEKSKLLLEAALSDIANIGQDLDEGYLDSLKELGLSDADYKTAKESYQKTVYKGYLDDINNGTLSTTAAVDQAYKSGKLTQEQYNSLKNEWNKSIDTSSAFFYYNGGNISYSDAKNAYNAVINNSWATDDVKSALKTTFTKTYAKDIAKEYYSEASNVVDTTASGFKYSNFGDVDGIDKAGDNQYVYITKILSDAKSGKIKVGQVVSLNYGAVWNDYLNYVYVGEGQFVKIKSSWNPSNYSDKLYLPDGYKLGGANGSVQKK